MTATRLPPSDFPGLFITGTDTGCGKTLVAAGMLHRLRSRGVRAVGMKPVASGCERTDAGLRNADALLLQEASEGSPGYDDVNPYAFEPPVAPHLAAAEAGMAIELDVIQRHLQALRADAELLIVEGVGGWAVPLGARLMLADLARSVALPVVLVVGMRLGCLNHAQISARAIRADGLEPVGWIANCLDPTFERLGANLNALRELLAPVSCLGVVDFHPDPAPADIAAHLRPDRLMAAAGFSRSGIESGGRADS